jgi:tetratricopeptide (TPR) repeat protein
MFSTKTITAVLIIIILCLSPALRSQGISEAKKMFYYERWKSAAAGFKKTSSTNPEAAYWLAESLLAEGNVAEAKKVVANAPTKFSNNPWMLVAAGHIELFEGSSSAAGNSFDKAISGADDNNKAAILNAVGRAHGNVSLKYGKPDFGIEKLRQAATLEPKNGSILINIGDCYRKKLDGAGSIEAYTDAMTIDPMLAAQANYKIGRVYAMQQNCVVFSRYFNEAIKLDAAFMPAWRELFDGYSDPESKCLDLSLAKTYFEKYVSTSDQGDEIEIARANFAYVSKEYAAAISTAKKLQLSMGETMPPRLYRLIGYSYFEQMDYKNCITWMAIYFSKEKNTDNITVHNYRTLAIAYDSTGNYDNAKQTWLMAADAETDATRKWFYYKQASEMAGKMKDKTGKAVILQMGIDQNAASGTLAYFDCGIAWYEAADYNKSIAAFTGYMQKSPTNWRGSLWLARNHAILDSTMLTGVAGPFYEKALELADNSTADIMAGAIKVQAYMYLFALNINLKKDKKTALAYLDKALSIEPDNAVAKKYKEMLSKTGGQ